MTIEELEILAQKKINSRTSRKAGNELIIVGKEAYIVLYASDNSPKAVAVIDTEDVARASAHTWGYDVSHGYARTIKPGAKYLHQFIYGFAPEGMTIDHLNRDKLDNRKANLRFATPQQQSFNKTHRSDGMVGVTFKPACTKRPWIARIQLYGKDLYLGAFATYHEACEARTKASTAYIT